MESQQDSEEILQAVFKAATDAIILINGSGIILDTNPATSRMFMHKREALVGSNVSMLMATPHRESHDAYLERHLTTGRTRIIGIGREVEALRGDGTRFPIELAVSRVDIADQVIFAGVIRDISDRREIINELETREDELRAIINTAGDAIIVISRYGMIRLFNPAAEKMFGYSVHEVLGRNVKMLMPAPSRNEHDQYIQAYIRSRNPKIIGSGREVIGQRKSNKTFPLHLSVSEAQSGNTTHFVAILRDLTEQRNLQRAVANKQEEERRRIGQELHDVLAQDLTALTLLTKSLETSAGELPESNKGQIRSINELARKALEESRRLARGLFPVGLKGHGLVATLQAWCEALNADSGIDIVFETTGQGSSQTDVEVELHVFRIAQEAVRNAVKHAGATQVLVRVACYPHQLDLSVIDDGGGFERGPQTSGMGLFTMEHRASILSADWVLESSPQGTRMTCNVPLQIPLRQAHD